MNKNLLLSLIIVAVMSLVSAEFIRTAKMSPTFASKQEDNGLNDPIRAHEGVLIVMAGHPPESNLTEIRNIEPIEDHSIVRDPWLVLDGNTALATLRTALGQRLLVVGNEHTKEVTSYEYLGDGKFSSGTVALRAQNAPLMLAALEQGESDYLFVGEKPSRGYLNLLQWDGNTFIVKKSIPHSVLRDPFLLKTVHDRGVPCVFIGNSRTVCQGVFDPDQSTINWEGRGSFSDKFSTLTFGQLKDQVHAFFGAKNQREITDVLFEGGRGSLNSRESLRGDPFSALSSFKLEGEDDPYLLGASGDQVEMYKVEAKRVSLKKSIPISLEVIDSIVTLPYHLQTQKGVQRALLERNPLLESIAKLIAQMTTGVKSSYYEDEKEAILAAPKLNIDRTWILLREEQPLSIYDSCEKLLKEFVLPYLKRESAKEKHKEVLEEWKKRAERYLNNDQMKQLLDRYCLD